MNEDSSYTFVFDSFTRGKNMTDENIQVTEKTNLKIKKYSMATMPLETLSTEYASIRPWHCQRAKTKSNQVISKNVKSQNFKVFRWVYFIVIFVDKP